jgi:hypothetical protein
MHWRGVVEADAAVVVLVTAEDGDRVGIADDLPEAVAGSYVLGFAAAPEGVGHMAAVGEGGLMHEDEYVLCAVAFGCGEVLFEPGELAGKEPAEVVAADLVGAAGVPVVGVELDKVAATKVEAVDRATIGR